MDIEFYKYHGTGNDFILTDHRQGGLPATPRMLKDMIAKLCHRRYGIGADGFMLLENTPKDLTGASFLMRYFNSDGNEASMCGNGGRCISAFAARVGATKSDSFRFLAVDGTHEAMIVSAANNMNVIRLSLGNSQWPKRLAPTDYLVNTGSPHLVLFRENVRSLNVDVLGREIRNNAIWKEEGININFVQQEDNGKLFVRTYERGVEGETLSCGTGVTAASLASWVHQGLSGKSGRFRLETMGGLLEVSFWPPQDSSGVFTNIELTGPVHYVYRGQITV